MELGPDFDEGLLRVLRERVARGLSAAAGRVLRDVRDAVRRSLEAGDEYRSLLAGTLREEFGVEEPQGVVNNIVNAVADSVNVSVLPAGRGDLGGLRVDAVRGDYSDVLAVPGASYVSVSLRRGTETLVPWLNWLLLAGDRVIVGDWQTLAGGRLGSRTGRMIMVSPTRRPPRGFRVDPAYSGVAGNNWLTRSMEAAVPEIEAALGRVLGDI